MRVKISKTKNAENFYIIKSTYVNKKHSTKIVEKLGNLEEVKLKAGAKDPYLWAKEYAKELTLKEKEGTRTIIKKYSQKVGLDKAEFFYRLLFCFVTCNSDMHLKNFSLIEDRPGSRSFSLSAAYDMLPVNVILPADKEQMALSLNGKKRNLRKKDFLMLAESLGIAEKVALGLMRQIVKYKERFQEEIKNSYVPDEFKERFLLTMQKRMEVFEA